MVASEGSRGRASVHAEVKAACTSSLPAVLRCGKIRSESNPLPLPDKPQNAAARRSFCFTRPKITFRSPYGRERSTKTRAGVDHSRRDVFAAFGVCRTSRISWGLQASHGVDIRSHTNGRHPASFVRCLIGHTVDAKLAYRRCGISCSNACFALVFSCHIGNTTAF